jgi:hypothetical protein
MPFRFLESHRLRCGQRRRGRVGALRFDGIGADGTKRAGIGSLLAGLGKRDGSQTAKPHLAGAAA